MTFEERKTQVRSYLGKVIQMEVDRPIGYIHKKGEKVLHYPINYGYIPGVLGGDGSVFLIKSEPLVAFPLRGRGTA